MRKYALIIYWSNDDHAFIADVLELAGCAADGTTYQEALATSPSCGSNKIKNVRRKWTGKFHGQTYSVPRLEFHKCPACGEKVYDREAMRKIEAHSLAFVKARAS